MAITQTPESKGRDALVTLLKADADVTSVFPAAHILGGRTQTLQGEPWLVLPQIVVRHRRDRDNLVKKIGVQVSQNVIFYEVTAFFRPTNEPIPVGEVAEDDRMRAVEAAIQRGSDDGTGTGTYDRLHRLLRVGAPNPPAPLDWLTENAPRIVRDRPVRISRSVIVEEEVLDAEGNRTGRQRDVEREHPVADIYGLIVSYEMQVNTVTGERRS
jgi:hypothetical protein